MSFPSAPRSVPSADLRPRSVFASITLLAVSILLISPASTLAAADSHQSPSQTPNLLHITTWTHPISELRALDIDYDGRMDIIITSKIVSQVQPFLQNPDSNFQPLPALTNVGFHPNGVLPLAAPSGRTLVAQNAETRGELRFYTFKDSADGPLLSFIDAIRVPRPWKTLRIHSANNELHLASFSKDQFEVALVSSLHLSPSLTHGPVHNLRGSGVPSGSAIESPILARVSDAQTERVLFIDSRRSVIRELDVSDDGTPRISDLYTLPEGTAAIHLAAADLNKDGVDDLAILGLNQDPLRLLISTENEDYELLTLPLASGYNQSAIFLNEEGGASTLLLTRGDKLMALRFQGDVTRPERRYLSLHPAVGSLMLESADINGDEVPDLLVGTTGRAAVPATILLGPVWDHMDELAPLLADPAANFGLREPTSYPQRTPRAGGPSNAPPLSSDLPIRLN